jgi:hypothetical protein
MEWAAVVSAVAGLLLYILKQYEKNQPKRDQEAAEDATQQGRDDIDDLDAVAVNNRIDRMFTKSDRPAGQSSSPVTTGRISAIRGVDNRQRGPGQDT